MTKEQIAVNAISAADMAGLDRRGYMMARMYDLLNSIDSTKGEDERLFADLEATAPAVAVVWSIGDEEDEEQDAEIAAAVAEAITDPEVDQTVLPEGITGAQNAHEPVLSEASAKQTFFERLGLKPVA